MRRRTVSLRTITFWLGGCVLVAAAAWLGASHLSPPRAALALALLVAALAWLWHKTQLVTTSEREHWTDVMPCYLSVQDRDLRILEVNQLFLRDFGDGKGEKCHRVYKQRDDPCPNCPVLKTFADGRDHISEETLTPKGSEPQKVVVTSTPLYDTRGNIEAVMEMSTNVTEVHALRGELERSRKHYRELFDIVPCYITVQNRDFEIIEANDLFRQDFGRAGSRRCYKAYKNRTEICKDCPVEKTFADGQIHQSEEAVITSEGREAAVMVYSMPVRDEAGEVTAVMEVSANITEVKALQRQLAMVGLAVTGMAHRIKNVLMGLEGGIFVVNTGMEENDDETLQSGWEMVQRNVVKVSRIAKDLLFCSKERVPEMTPGVSPKAIARDVYELFLPRMAREEVTLRLEVTDADDAGELDAEAVHMLLTNLVSNALDACRFDEAAEGKRHEIVIRSDLTPDGDILLEVADNGAGISKEDAERVFTGFFSSKGTEGTGLGLFVVETVVRQHKGHITFDTDEGVGTTFRVRLPRVPPRGGSQSSSK